MKIVTLDKLKAFYNKIDTSIVRTGVCDNLPSQINKSVTVSPAFTTLKPGMQVIVKFPENEALDPTLNVNGTTAYPVVVQNGSLHTSQGARLLSGYCHLIFADDSWYLVSSGYTVKDPFIFTTGSIPVAPEQGTIWLKQKE